MKCLPKKPHKIEFPQQSGISSYFQGLSQTTVGLSGNFTHNVYVYVADYIFFFVVASSQNFSSHLTW